MHRTACGIALLVLCACGSGEGATDASTTTLVGPSTGASTQTASSEASQTAATGDTTSLNPTSEDSEETLESTGDTDPSTASESESESESAEATTDNTTETPTQTSDDSGSDTETTDEPTEDLCIPEGNLIEVGGLDEIVGNTPLGWELRSPGMVEACADSGPHVWTSQPAPSCAGAAVTIDANGAWDCYAVQTVSPYNSIEGGATYRIRATVRSQGNTVNPAAWFILGVQWLDENDGFFGDEKNPQPEHTEDHDFEWKVLEWEVVAPPNARRILIWLTAHYPGEVSYDHVAVLKID